MPASSEVREELEIDSLSLIALFERRLCHDSFEFTVEAIIGTKNIEQTCIARRHVAYLCRHNFDIFCVVTMSYNVSLFPILSSLDMYVRSDQNPNMFV